ncbi:hypothetical protein EJB05_36195, partial [Eragrostis curvula]
MHWLLPGLFLICSLSLLAAPTIAEDDINFECVSNTNYTRGGAFQANLDALLSSLPAAAAASWGFAKNAYGLAQCRRDVSAPVCSKCVEKLAQKLRAGCRGLKSGIIFSETCMLRHSNVSFFGEADSSYLIYYNAAENVTEPELFKAGLPRS